MSEIDLDNDCAAYMLECRRFLERVEAFKLPKLAGVIVRIVQCFSASDSQSKSKVPVFVQRLLDDGMYEQALIETICKYASFTTDRNTWYNFTFFDKVDGSRSRSVVSDASSFGLALASAYIYWRYHRLVSSANLPSTELQAPAAQFYE